MALIFSTVYMENPVGCVFIHSSQLICVNFTIIIVEVSLTEHPDITLGRSCVN